MSTENPEVVAGDIIEDVEARLSSPGISTDTYLPWVSYAYQKTFNALSRVGQHVREAYFGASGEIELSQSTLEHVIADSLPRFGGLIAIEVKYGATGDARTTARNIISKANWKDFDHVSTTYWPKGDPLYYILGGSLGIIPVAPEAGAIAYLDYVKKPYKIDLSADIIDLPYQFIYPVVNYVQAKAIETTNEDYQEGQAIENKFLAELAEIQEAAASEFNENDGTDSIQDVSGISLRNPLDY